MASWPPYSRIVGKLNFEEYRRKRDTNIMEVWLEKRRVVGLHYEWSGQQAPTFAWVDCQVLSAVREKHCAWP